MIQALTIGWARSISVILPMKDSLHDILVIFFYILIHALAIA
jgi:hypothetical protein